MPDQHHPDRRQCHARTGDTISTAIGDQGAKQKGDPNGRRLHELLLSNHLAAANAFVGHGPEHRAWDSGKSPLRIDYVVIPKGYVDSIEACSVLWHRHRLRPRFQGSPLPRQAGARMRECVFDPQGRPRARRVQVSRRRLPQ
eukprot:8004818-Pyramimonas_sp.AAC.1